MKKQNRVSKNQINFRVTDVEMSVLQVNAERAGLTVPAYCKRLALGTKIKPQIMDKDTGKAILPILAHAGSNLNQIAKKANEGGSIAGKELAELKAEFAKIWDFVLDGKKPPKPHKTEMKENGIHQSGDH